jgi:hypothetical protein
MGDEVFRLPKSSYDELVKIIRAYGSTEREVSLDELKQTSGMHETIISSNNAFLVAMGIIEGGKAKKPTAKGRDLAIALQHNIAEQVSANWRDIVIGSEFLNKMVTAVSIRQGMEYSALQSHIAYSLGEPKKSNVMAGAGAVIEILKIAGYLVEEDGKLVAKGTPPVSMQTTKDSTPSKQGGTTTFKRDNLVPPSVASTLVPGVSIQIQVQCSASDLSELGPKLRSLLKELAKPEEPDTKDA